MESALPQRDIETVTSEIHDICAQAQRMMLIYAVEIGRRLVEAKSILPHGSWGEWLKSEVRFSQSTANKHMKLFEAYGSKQFSLFGAELNSETFTNLSYSQALKLLAVPDDERESFVKENDIEDKSVREIDKLIKERDEAVKRAEEEGEANAQHISDLEEKLDSYKRDAEDKKGCVEKLNKSIDELKIKLEKANAAQKKAKEKADRYKKAAENPEIPPEQINRLKAEAEEAAKKAASEEAKQFIKSELEDMRKRLAEAEQAAAEARETADEEERKRTALQQKISMSNPSVVRFKTIFEQTQDNLNAMIDIINQSEDTVKDKLKRVYLTLFDSAKEMM